MVCAKRSRHGPMLPPVTVYKLRSYSATVLVHLYSYTPARVLVP